MLRRNRYRMNHKSRYRKKASASYGFFELLFLTFRRLLHNPAAAIMMLTLLQVMMLPQAEAKKEFDWSEVPEDLDLDMHEIDPRDFDVREMDLDVTDLTEQTQVHEITDLRTEDITEEYRRYLTPESKNVTQCLQPVVKPASFFQLIGLRGVSSSLALAVEPQGSLWITGNTESFGAVESDVFLARFSPEGNLTKAFRWGGSDDDIARSLAIDPKGALWVTGYTESFDVGKTDVFLVQFSPEGSLIKALRWDGLGNSSEYARSLVIDSQGSIWITGEKYSVTAKERSIFLMKFSPAGNLIKSLNWGGSDDDYAWSLAIDSQGAVWVTGYTSSFGAVNSDVLLVRFSPEGSLMQAFRWGGELMTILLSH